MNKIKTYMLLGAFAFAFTACEEKTEYVPAEPEKADCLGVYFDESNPIDYIFIPGSDATLNLKMHRLNTAQSVDVPIIGSASVDGVEFPSMVHFDAGSADADICVDCSNLPVSQKARIRIDLPEDAIHHYAATLFNFEATVLISQWEPANVDGSPVKFYFTEYNYFGTNQTPINALYLPIECEMEILPGAQQMRIKNFLNAGVDILFSVSESPYEDFAQYHRLSPMDHYYTMVDAFEDEGYGDDWFNPWYLMDDSFDYATAKLTGLNGNPSDFEYPYLLWYSDTELQEYAYAWLKGEDHNYNEAMIGLGGSPVDDLTLPDYFYLYFRWDGASSL